MLLSLANEMLTAVTLYKLKIYLEIYKVLFLFFFLHHKTVPTLARWRLKHLEQNQANLFILTEAVPDYPPVR